MADGSQSPDVLRRRKGEEGFVVDQDTAWEAAKLTDEEIDRIELKRRKAFNPKDKTKDKIARALGDISVAASKKINQHELQANTDGLTGLLNKDGLHAKLAGEIKRSEQLGTSLSVLFIEPDNFKSVNDNRGHAAGDAVLIKIASFLQDQTKRDVDSVARWGGDEFVVVLNGAEIADAPFRADDIRKKFNDSFADFGLTTSIGVAEFRPGQDPKTLVEAADKAMYYVKHNGKDGVGVILGKGQIVDFAKAKATTALPKK